MTDSVDTVLVGGAVITMDSERRVLDPGAVAVSDSRIVAVGERERILAEHSDAAQVDLGGTVLLPGLVDSHGHAGHGLTKNLTTGNPFDWLDVVSDVYFRTSDESFWRAESYLAALEHIENGVTTSISFPGSQPRTDDPKFAVAAAEGYAELGLRHIVAIGPPAAPFPQECIDVETGSATDVDLDHSLRTADEAIDRLHGTADGRLSAYVGPSSLVPEAEVDGEPSLVGLGGDGIASGEGTASDLSKRQLDGVIELAETHDVPIHTHAYAGMIALAAEARPEVLSPRLSLAHCAGVDEHEMELMADNGVSASHGPLTHAYVTKRFPVIEAMERGVNVAISTDGAGPDRSFDLLSQGRIAAQLQRTHFNDSTLLPAGRILEMMTIDAARALDLHDEVGSLEPGKRADVIALDLESARLRPRFSLVDRVVSYAQGSDVTFVMVDGETLLRDRSFDDIDVRRILENADDAAVEAVERAGHEDALRSHPGWGTIRYE